MLLIRYLGSVKVHKISFGREKMDFIHKIYQDVIDQYKAFLKIDVHLNKGLNFHNGNA